MHKPGHCLSESIFHPSITPLGNEERGPISLQSVDVVVTEFLQNPHQNGGIVIIQDSKLKKKEKICKETFFVIWKMLSDDSYRGISWITRRKDPR